MNGGNRIHRGAALLLALAAIVILAAGSVALAAIASRAQLTRSWCDAALVADDLLASAEAPILNWLRSESSRVVLPPDADSPEVIVLHDVLAHEGRAAEIRITAWDQDGMAPLTLVKAGSPLRLALPEHVLERLDAGEPTNESSVNQPASGLNVFAAPFDRASASPFPKPLRDGLSAVGSRLSAESREPRAESHFRLPARNASDPIALGALISTHSGRINVNTAPIPLLEQAMRHAGRGGIDVIHSNRAAGMPTNMAAVTAAGPAQSDAVAIVSTSSAWGFRIDVRIDMVQRSWWVVYSRSSGAARRTSGGWECAQRMVIHD